MAFASVGWDGRRRRLLLKEKPDCISQSPFTFLCIPPPSYSHISLRGILRKKVFIPPIQKRALARRRRRRRLHLKSGRDSRAPPVALGVFPKLFAGFKKAYSLPFFRKKIGRASVFGPPPVSSLTPKGGIPIRAKSRGEEEEGFFVLREVGPPPLPFFSRKVIKCQGWERVGCWNSSPLFFGGGRIAAAC